MAAAEAPEGGTADPAADCPRAVLAAAFPPDPAERPSLIDLRSAEAFMASRLSNSCHVPLDELVPRMFLLPDRTTPLALLVEGPPAETLVHGAAAPGGAKEDIQVAAFLRSRGWTVALCAQATPELLRAAAEAGLLEEGGDPAALRRRWPFQPSRLLLRQVGPIEEMLARSWLESQDHQQPGAEPGPSGVDKAEDGARRLRLRVLDVGCGSGRDLAWLATRESTVALALGGPPPSSAVKAGSGAGLEGDAMRAAADAIGAVAEAGAEAGARGASGSGASSSVDVRVSWECVGLDSWHGALTRAAEALSLGGVPGGPGGVTLHLAQIEGGSGELRALPLPPAPNKDAVGRTQKRHEQHRLLLTYLPQGQGQGQQQGPGQGQEPAGAASAPAETATASAPSPTPATASGAGTAAAATSASAPGSALELGTFDVVLCVRFLERSFLPRMAALLRPGGFLLYSTFVDGPGLRAFGRPSGRDHVLQRDELAGACFGPGQGFEVVLDEVGLTADGREVSLFCARKVAAQEDKQGEKGEQRGLGRGQAGAAEAPAVEGV
ncbi:hypothetical protein HYH03_002166 [Edaphochlamys debaryana]|uniref:Uncharacterized protein n=1 Tax=Edaphochlamys debaryana TaxID=47281 RepID=A0A835YBG2_9CHLO|nr:hypothetical protein HYH03_002166 [Edaphochlamys debaryana]|eukprot:KAG2499875.1 hypothetical protein HYH03_002166 [Edaphochlamys debaryana]